MRKQSIWKKLMLLTLIGSMTLGDAMAVAAYEVDSADLQVRSETPTAEEPLLLTQERLLTTENGYGSTRFDGCNAGGSSITLYDGSNPVTYGRGIGMHAYNDPSRDAYADFDVAGLNYNVFRATVGVDYNSDNTYTSRGTCRFKVMADGVELAVTPVLMDRSTQYELKAMIPEGTQVLRLAVDNGGDHDTCDWADWVDPRLEVCEDLAAEWFRMDASLESDRLFKGEKTSIAVSGYGLDGSEIPSFMEYCQFTSSDEQVALLGEDGTVTAVGIGSAVLNVVASDGVQTLLSQVSVTVLPSKEEGWIVTSPSENIEFQLYQDADGSLKYLAYRDGRPVMESSGLGLITSIGSFDSGLTYIGRTDTEINETYSMVTGKKAEYTNHAIESVFSFEKDGVIFKIIARAYDDGTAFRYAIDGEDAFTISDETTVLQVPAKSRVTMASAFGSFNSSCEEVFVNTTIEQTNSGMHNFPFLYRTTEDDWVLFTEAALSGEYCGSYLKAAGGRVMEVEFKQNEDVVTQAPWVSPWRTAIIGGAEEIAENTMVENLSPACKLEDTSWIEPGTAAWTWYVSPGFGPQSDPDLIKQYIDAAAELGWKYYLMDEGWQGVRAPNDTVDGQFHRWVGIPDWLDEVVAYGKERGVSIMAWIHNKDIDTPKEQEFLKELADHGIVGLKIDFFDSESQETMKWYDTLYEMCAEYHLMLNIHGANKTTGEVRTWPHLVTREGIYAQEFNNVNADHTTNLVFTRTAVGPADFNPCIDLLQGGNVTAAHKAALNIMYETGLPCPSDKTETYKRYQLLPIMKDLPARWDELKFIDGAPGELATLARRNGDDWYIGSICVAKQDMVVPLDFLDEGEYYAYIYKDGASRWDLDVEVRTVTSADTLSVPMSANGGCTVKITKEEPLFPEIMGFENEEETICPGQTKNLNLVMEPDVNGYPVETEWSSSDDSVVSVQNGTITAYKLGAAVITAKVSSKMEGVSGSMTAKCLVNVERNRSYQLAKPWILERPAGAFKVNSKNSITIPVMGGEANTSDNTAKNYVSMPVEDEDFTVTVKCDFDAVKANQSAGILVNADNKRYVGILRRDHAVFGSDIIESIKADGGYEEPFVKDPNPKAPVYLKVEKEGNLFRTYYSYDGEEWQKVGEHTLTLQEGKSWRVAVCAFDGNGNENAAATMEDFTYNGKLVPFGYMDDAAYQITSAETLEAICVEKGTSADALNLPATVLVMLDDGESTRVSVDWDLSNYDPDTEGICHISGTLKLPLGLENAAGLTVSQKVIVGSHSFTDVKDGDWYQEAVNYVYEKELMTGVDETHTIFAPGKILSRAEFAVILHRMEGTPDVEFTDRFPDVSDGTWFADAALWAADAELIGGYKDNGMFGPADALTREQMAAVLYRYASYKKYDTSVQADLSQYEDAEDVSAFAEEAMSWAVGAGIITGKEDKTRLDPQGSTNRAEAAVMLMRFMKTIC